MRYQKMLTISLQILSITADNASSNDTLTTELADLVAHFGGPTSRTRCFLHVINLVAKSLIKQFDLPKDIATDALQSPNSEMARDASSKNEATIAENGDGDPDAEDADNEDGWVDEINQLTAHERTAFETNIRPIRLMLAKVSWNSYMIRDVKIISPLTSYANSPSRLSTLLHSFSPRGKTPPRNWDLDPG
jgi:hypothetical protein